MVERELCRKAEHNSDQKTIKDIIRREMPKEKRRILEKKEGERHG